MFNKILIANRGEIACRVIKTARTMGIQTVAVYSEADRHALHVSMADEAIAIGPAPAAQSYLVIDNIIQACKASAAEAVHPGYGFLSENAEFARALDKAGISFIGPNIAAIEAMGDKITSKKIAQKAGVNTIPGHTEIIKDADQAVMIARDIGYPVMLKASAGGGGKGMRIARNDDECRDGFERSTSEARSSFGDDRVFIEKYIEQPRHIEIQIMADQQGNVVYLGERECSIQRRHQKVIEEAPSPFLDETTRQAMGEQACALARAVKYRSAGTVEFVVDRKRQFYFLEMNTRLQVEHPVTELITGLDLVELMILVAAGEPLGLTQEEISISGWALEARIYAEDPLRGFLPSIGRLVQYQAPPEGRFVRVDSGVQEGGEVSMYYDPMIAKLVAWNINREHAINGLGAALNEFYIRGVSHNIEFLTALLKHPRFIKGDLSTNFIAEEYPEGFALVDPEPNEALVFVSVVAIIHRLTMARLAAIDGQLPSHEFRIRDDWVVLLNGQYYPVIVAPAGGGDVVIYADEHLQVNHDWRLGDPLFRATIEGEDISVQVEPDGVGYQLSHGGLRLKALVMTPSVAEYHALMPVKEEPDLSQFLLSPMPGLLIQIMISEGDQVQAGQALAVIEAMKMENVLRAERPGKVAKILANTGDSLAVDQPIIEFDLD